MKNFTFLIVFVFIPLSFAQQADVLTQIRYQGNYVIIPENKMGEFMKNYDKYVPKKQEQFAKPNSDYIKDGHVYDAFTGVGIAGIELIFPVYDYITPIDTLGPIYTNSQGYYTLTVTDVDDNKETNNMGEIRYQIKNTPQIELKLNKLSKVEIKLYDLLGQELNVLLEEETDDKIILTDIDNLASGLYILQIKIDGKPYTNKLLKTETYYHFGKSKDQIVEKDATNNLEKITEPIYMGRWMNDPDNQYHRYDHLEGEPLNENLSKDFALLPRMYLDSAFVDPNYTVIDTIKTFRDLYWYMFNIQGDWDNRIRVPPLYNFRLFIDTVNCPVEWKLPIRNSIQYLRDSLATYLGMHPDSLIVESPEFNDPLAEVDISPINLYYADTLPNNRDSWRMVYYNTFLQNLTGADITLNLSTEMQSIDVFKEITRNIEEYIVGGSGDVERNPPWMLINKWGRGPRYTYHEDDKKLIKIGRNIQKTNKFTYYNRIFP